MSFGDWHYYHFTAPAFDFARTDDRLRFVIATLHDHIRPQCIHEIELRVLVEKNDEVNALETCNKVRTVAFAAHRTGRSLESFHRRIGIDPDNQCVTACAGSCEQIQMPRMQKIEYAVGENDSSFESFSASCSIISRRRDFVGGQSQLAVRYVPRPMAEGARTSSSRMADAAPDRTRPRCESCSRRERYSHRLLRAEVQRSQRTIAGDP